MGARRRTYAIDANAAEWALRMFEWFVNGDSAITIAVKLNEAGVPSPRDRCGRLPLEKLKLPRPIPPADQAPVISTQTLAVHADHSPRYSLVDALVPLLLLQGPVEWSANA